MTTSRECIQHRCEIGIQPAGNADLDGCCSQGLGACWRLSREELCIWRLWQLVGGQHLVQHSARNNLQIYACSRAQSDSSDSMHVMQAAPCTAQCGKQSVGDASRTSMAAGSVEHAESCSQCVKGWLPSSGSLHTTKMHAANEVTHHQWAAVLGAAGKIV
jgi:hypothetical protein